MGSTRVWGRKSLHVRVEQEQFVFRTSELGKVEIEEIYKENMLKISLNLRL